MRRFNDDHVKWQAKTLTGSLASHPARAEHLPKPMEGEPSAPGGHRVLRDPGTIVWLFTRRESFGIDMPGSTTPTLVG